MCVEIGRKVGSNSTRKPCGGATSFLIVVLTILIRLLCDKGLKNVRRRLRVVQDVRMLVPFVQVVGFSGYYNDCQLADAQFTGKINTMNPANGEAFQQLSDVHVILVFMIDMIVGTTLGGS